MKTPPRILYVLFHYHKHHLLIIKPDILLLQHLFHPHQKNQQIHQLKLLSQRQILRINLHHHLNLNLPHKLTVQTTLLPYNASQHRPEVNPLARYQRNHFLPIHFQQVPLCMVTLYTTYYPLPYISSCI